MGAEVQKGGGVEFRVWAPRRKRVDVVIDGPPVPLRAERNGYFAGLVKEARAGSRYGFRLNGAGRLYPDPASRFQPGGPHGPSEVVDPSRFRWTDQAWKGVESRGHVIYEMHVGTFTPEGTFAAAARELDALADLGVTLIELMPVADFPGRFGWGYDGVNLFAPTRLYGTPDDLRRFVDAAHARRVGVIADVVYNHFGPDGNYLSAFSSDYESTEHVSDWGGSPNFEGKGSGPVREFVIANAGYWIDEFHMDGLRLDATQQIYDDSPRHILAEVTRQVERCARGRGVYVIAENEEQNTRLFGPRNRGGFGVTALWNDDFHHSARVALTGRAEAYYTDYRGTPQEFISESKRGFLYQGQWYGWQNQRRGSSTRGIAIDRFIAYLENHDQIANTGNGRRLHQLASPALYRAMTALLLLGPETPLLFQGQEYGAEQPFLYFADHRGDLARAVREGRAKFLTQFPSLATPEAQRELPDPADRRTFERCKLDPRGRRARREHLALHRDLLRLRREDPVLAAGVEVDGAVIGERAFVLRFFGARAGGDRLLVLNLGREERLDPVNDPLLVAPEGSDWTLAWSSEHPRYGGEGTPRPRPGSWALPGNSALLLQPLPRIRKA